MTETFYGNFSGSSAYRLVSKEGENFVFEWTIEDNHPHLDGHFDSWPILPGASQVGLVLETLAYSLQKSVKIVHVKKVKFMAMIQPTRTLNIVLKCKTPTEVHWEIKDVEKTYSKGAFLYE